eukprot:TRINITY_DN1226_c0_g1_i1.p1 TRINITY_DN1226_c0_g1~~TRINITY_DN1226_c0_g1_i1.p1  ORF type:complete len:313 (-),score=55.00 TRINITY_DN1226_c0_g1_i1:777-1715(-)
METGPLGPGGRLVGENPAESASTATACQECGNQAKKDCTYNRCRTCCKSRGFLCSTHVKSTWVPAAKRRERQQLEQAQSASGVSAPKKRSRTTVVNSPAVNDKSSELTAPNHPLAVGAKMQLPAEITAQTLLKSVRVNGLVDGVFEFGYHATAKIGGHIFKGVLYNAGVDISGESGASQPPPAQHQESQHPLARSTGHPAALIDPGAFYSAAGSLLGGDRGSLLGGERSLLSGDRVPLLGGDRSALLGGDRSSLLGGDRGSLLGGDRGHLLGSDRGGVLGVGVDRGQVDAKDQPGVSLSLSAFSRAHSSLGL